MKLAPVVVACLCTALAHAQTPPAVQIFGKVIDASSDAGVGGVEVMLMDDSTSPPKRLEPKGIGTRADGTYSVPLAAALSKKTTLLLHFSKVGYYRDPTPLVPNLASASLPQEDVRIASRKQSVAYYNELAGKAKMHGPTTPDKPSPYLPIILALPEQERTQTMHQLGKLDARIYVEYSMALQSDLAVKVLTQKYIQNSTDFGFKANATVPGSVLVFGKVKTENDKARVLQDLYSKGSDISITDELLVRNTAKPLPTDRLVNLPKLQFSSPNL